MTAMSILLREGLSSWSVENIAALLTALLFGFKPEDVELATFCDEIEGGIDADDANIVEDDEEMVCRACRPISDEVEADDVLALSSLTTHSVDEHWVDCPVCEGGINSYDCHECGGKGGWWDDPSTIDAYFTTTGDNPVLMDQYSIRDQERSAGGSSDLTPEYATHYVPFFYKGTRKQWDKFSTLMQKVRTLDKSRARKWLSKWQSVDRFERVGKVFRMTRAGVASRFIWKPVYLNTALVREGKLTKRQAWSVYQALKVQSA